MPHTMTINKEMAVTVRRKRGFIFAMSLPLGEHIVEFYADEDDGKEAKDAFKGTEYVGVYAKEG